MGVYHAVLSPTERIQFSDRYWAGRSGLIYPPGARDISVLQNPGAGIALSAQRFTTG